MDRFYSTLVTLSMLWRGVIYVTITVSVFLVPPMLCPKFFCKCIRDVSIERAICVPFLYHCFFGRDKTHEAMYDNTPWKLLVSWPNQISLDPCIGACTCFDLSPDSGPGVNFRTYNSMKIIGLPLSTTSLGRSGNISLSVRSFRLDFIYVCWFILPTYFFRITVQSQFKNDPFVFLLFLLLCCLQELLLEEDGKHW